MKKKALIAGVMFAAMGAAAGSARAVPIIIEFDGTVDSTTHVTWLSSNPLNGEFSWDDSLLGQAVRGRITLETDGLTEVTNSTPGFSNLLIYNPSSDPLRLVTSELTIDGLDYFIDAYPYQSGGIALQDVQLPDGHDIIEIRHNYSERLSGSGIDGLYPGSGLMLRWIDLDDPHGLVDLSQDFDLLEMASTLNRLPVQAQYITWTNSCIDGGCMTITQSFTFLNISSFQVHAASVPEPGTLGLFAAGLLGAGLVRRRRQP